MLSTNMINAKPHTPWMAWPLAKVMVEVEGPSSVLVRETQEEGEKPRAQVLSNLALTGSLWNKEKEVLFLYFFFLTLQRKNETWLWREKKKYKMHSKSSITSRLMKVDRKMETTSPCCVTAAMTKNKTLGERTLDKSLGTLILGSNLDVAKYDWHDLA